MARQHAEPGPSCCNVDMETREITVYDLWTTRGSVQYLIPSAKGFHCKALV